MTRIDVEPKFHKAAPWLQRFPAAVWGTMKTVRRKGLPVVPTATIVVFLVIPALFAPWIAPHDPMAGGLAQRLRPPVGFGGEWTHLMGTDRLGRDVFSRVIYGARISSYIFIVGILISASIGVLAGLVAGFYGKFADSVIMRLVDMTLAFPAILLAIVLAAVIGPSFLTTQIVIAFILWAIFARQIRAGVVSLMEQDFISLAKVNGLSGLRIMLWHVLPNVMSTVIVLATLNIGYVIILESSLSFLGVGLPPPTPAWGLMVADGRALVVSAWWVAFFPGLAITLVVLAANSIGDWMGSNLDPRAQKVG